MNVPQAPLQLFADEPVLQAISVLRQIKCKNYERYSANVDLCYRFQGPPAAHLASKSRFL